MNRIQITNQMPKRKPDSTFHTSENIREHFIFVKLKIDSQI